MISLDEKMFDPESRVSKRMIEYGKKEKIYILIPSQQKKDLRLSQNVRVFGSGGNKIQQFFQLYTMGKRLIRDQDIKHITVQDPFFTALAGYLIQHGSNASLEIQIHGDFFGSYYKKNILRGLIAKFLIHKAESIRVVSERIRESLLKLKIDQKKIEVKPIDVQLSVHVSQTEAANFKVQFPKFQKYFLSMGRLEKVKNIDFLIDLFFEIVHARHLNYFLCIVGDGSEKQNIQKKIQERGLEKNIYLHAWADPWGFYSSADALLFPSLSEGYGLVAMEASSVGLAIIMNDVGVANFELKPGEKVKIISVQEKEKWIQAIESI